MVLNGKKKGVLPPACVPPVHSPPFRCIYFQILSYFFWDLFLFINNLLILLYLALQI